MEIMKSDGRNVSVTVEKMLDEWGKEMESCPHPKQKIQVLFSEVPEKLDLVRVESKG